MKENKLITDLAIDFIEKHWDEIDLVNADIKDTKSEYIELIKKDYDIACWVVSDLMLWGCGIDYLKQYKVECETMPEHEDVIKIGDTYFMTSDDYRYVKSKFKLVMCYE